MKENNGFSVYFMAKAKIKRYDKHITLVTVSLYP